MSRHGAMLRQLTDDAHKVGTARFSPDGTTVLYSRIDPGSRRHVRGSTGDAYGLYTVKLAGGEPVRIARIEAQVYDLHLMRFAWRPDGKRVAYTWQQLHEEFLKKDTIGGSDVQIETEAFLIVADPDGKNQKTVASGKLENAINMIFGAIDWR